MRKEIVQSWELINPEGVVGVQPIRLNVHPRTLKGKTVLLRWNGKHNGDLFLDRVAELLAKHVKGVKVIKAWAAAPDTAIAISGSQEASVSLSRKLSELEPDIVIGSYGD